MLGSYGEKHERSISNSSSRRRKMKDLYQWCKECCQSTQNWTHWGRTIPSYWPNSLHYSTFHSKLPTPIGSKCRLLLLAWPSRSGPVSTHSPPKHPTARMVQPVHFLCRFNLHVSATSWDIRVCVCVSVFVTNGDALQIDFNRREGRVGNCLIHFENLGGNGWNVSELNVAVSEWV
jgi:hypothetical protein